MLIMEDMISTVCVCLSETLCHEKNEGMSCIIIVCHDLKLHGCYVTYIGILPLYANTDAYTMILCIL